MSGSTVWPHRSRLTCSLLTLPYLSLANLKLLVVVIDDWCSRSGGTREGHTLVVSGQLNGSLTGHSVGGVEANSSGDSAEHGEVLQGHLRGTVLTWREEKRGSDREIQ